LHHLLNIGTRTTLARSLGEYRGLWRFWLPLAALTIVTPLIALCLPLLERRLIDQIITPGRLDLLPATIAVYGLLWAGLAAAQQVGGLLRGYLGARYLARMRQRVFDQCGQLAVAFAHREHSGRTLSLFTSDLPTLADFLNSAVVLGLGSIVALCGAVVMMFRLSPQLAIAGAFTPLVVAAISIFVTRPLRPAARRVQEKIAEITERLQEHLTGMREVVAFGREPAERTRFSTTLDALVKLRLRVMLLDTGVQTGQTALSLAVTLVLLGYGSYLVIRGDITLGTLIAMRSLFNLLFQPIGQVLSLVSGTQQALGSADRVQAFLDQTPQVTDAATARPLQRVVGRVTFDDVHFAYSTDRPVLQGVSFVAEPGQTVALVGPSGAGKSTIASLLARFYDTTSGRVLLDTEDVRDVTLSSLRAQIGFVFQDTFLFAGTLRDNIAFGQDDVTEEDITAAARAANAWEFIERLPGGLNTHVGERGIRLSEGQRQRIGIARALIRDPRVLILDEPTSALDARSEQLVQSALERSKQGRTTFIIAHRLATIEAADRILVLDSGRIVEAGSHTELLGREGMYRMLSELQFSRPASNVIPFPGSASPAQMVGAAGD
jgi:ABC-type multidrug transport system fused ATPase/permease subunit